MSSDIETVKKQRDRIFITGALLMSFVVSLIYAYDFFFMVGDHGVSGSDVKTQIGYVEFWYQSGSLPDMCQAYPLYYIIIRGLYELIGRWTPVIILFTLVWSFGTNILQIFFVRKLSGEHNPKETGDYGEGPGRKESLFYILAGSALSFAWPISFKYSFFGGTAFWEMPLEQVFLTSGATSPNHSLTYLCVKPFALLVIYLFTVIIYSDDRKAHGSSNRQYVMLSLFLFLSVLAKPNFYQVFAPAGTILTIAFFFKKGRSVLNKCLKMAAAFLPATVWVLYAMKYKLNTYAISPLEGISLFADNTPLAAVLLRAVVFCLFVTVCAVVMKKWSMYMIPGWLMYGIGTGLFLLLIEPEDVLTLSMSWGYYIGQYVLFAMSVITFARMCGTLKGTRGRLLIPVGNILLALHAFFGVAVFVLTWYPWWSNFLKGLLL